MNASVRIWTAFSAQRSTSRAEVSRRSIMQIKDFRHMRPSNVQLVSAGAVPLVLMAAASLGPEPRVRTPVSPDDFVRAVAMHCDSIIELYLAEHFDPNAQVAHGRTLLLVATLQQDWETAQRLMDAG